MKRTASQIAADHLLTQAIEQVGRAYGYPQDFVLGDYVVAAATTRIDGDSELEHDTILLVRDCNLPSYRTRGLLLDGVHELDNDGFVGIADDEDADAG